MKQWVRDADGTAYRLVFNASLTIVTVEVARGVYSVFPLTDPTLGPPYLRLVYGPHASPGVTNPNQEGQFRGAETSWLSTGDAVYFEGGQYDFVIAGLPATPGFFTAVLQRMKSVDCE